MDGLLQRGDVAAVILEPVGGQARTALTIPEYLEELRALTTPHGVVLIFDEVITEGRVEPRLERRDGDGHHCPAAPRPTRRLFRMATEVLHGIEAGVSPPHPGWQCGECPYRGRC